MHHHWKPDWKCHLTSYLSSKRWSCLINLLTNSTCQSWKVPTCGRSRKPSCRFSIEQDGKWSRLWKQNRSSYQQTRGLLRPHGCSGRNHPAGTLRAFPGLTLSKLSLLINSTSISIINSHSSPVPPRENLTLVSVQEIPNWWSLSSV